MNISVTGRGMNVLDNVRLYAEQKAGKLERFDDQLQKIEVVISIEGDNKVVEMIAVPRKGGPIVGQTQHEDVHAAIDLVVDKMSQQLRKAKDKRKTKRKRSGRVPPPPSPSDLVEDEKLESYDEVVEEFSENLDVN